VNEKDQRRFSFIENLISKEIPRMTLPEEFGEGPVYSPTTKRPSSKGNNRNGKKKVWIKRKV
jgi:hypothetical protein